MRALLLLFSLVGTAPAQDPAPVGVTGSPAEQLLIGPELLDPVLELPEDARAALIERDHAAAVTALGAIDRSSLFGHQVDDLAFVLAWERIRAGKAADSIVDIEVIRKADHVPAPYLALTLGELLLADERPVEAIEALTQVPAEAPIWPRAMLRLAKAYEAAGRTAEARDTFIELTERPDPAEGTPQALWALAQRAHVDNPAAVPHLRRLWAAYPRTSEGLAAGKALVPHVARSSSHRASRSDIATRADALMNAWAFNSVTNLVSANAGLFREADEASCKAWYAQGRSHFRRNNVTLAAEILIPAGKRCAGIDDDRGAKALYIAGKSLERKKHWAEAAQAYEQIPALYPDHSMADDGYALSGVGWQIAGEDATARERWTTQVTTYPKGDLAGEGFWRLAWTAYREGDPAEAIRWAEKMIWDVPYNNDPVHVMAAHYWSARWRLYPDVSAPTVLNTDTAAVEQGIALLARLCADHPTRFYSLLAAARLYELRPEAVSDLPRPPSDGAAPGTWTVRASFLASGEVDRAVALVRLGLVPEALSELGQLDREELSSSEIAFISTLEAQSDWLRAHDRLHKYLLGHPASTLTVDRERILKAAYPDHFWEEVRTATSDASYDARIFHALVREESSFNQRIVSHAGARGLSQLMPATAREVGGRLGLRVTNETMFDPATNLRIGGHYLDNMMKRYDGNPFLAVPSYNAGPGNVDKWLRAQDGGPTDEYIESIPIRETRHYVKRVLGTYQLYRSLYGTGPLYPDWSSTNHLAQKAP